MIDVNVGDIVELPITIGDMSGAKFDRTVKATVAKLYPHVVLLKYKVSDGREIRTCRTYADMMWLKVKPGRR